VAEAARHLVELLQRRVVDAELAALLAPVDDLDLETERVAELALEGARVGVRRRRLGFPAGCGV